MALQREVGTLDEVPEYAKAGYKAVEANGKTTYVNDDIEDVAALRNTAKARKEERERAETELKPFKDLGLSPKELVDLRAEIARKRDDGGSEKDVETLIAKRVKAKEEEFAPVVTERDTLRNEVRQLKLTDKVRADFIAAKGIEDDADLMLRDTEGRFDLNDKGKIVVLDDEGDPTGQTPREWFEKVYLKKRPKFFKGTGAAGGGATQGDSGGSGALAEIAKLPPAERISRLRAVGVKS